MITCIERKNTKLRHFPQHMLSYVKIGVIGKEGGRLQLPVDAYLDIETTGLCSFYDEITVIGVCLANNFENRLVQLVGGDVTRSNLLRTLRCVNTIYTYNGSRFDLPFIKAKLEIDLKDHFKHTDLMYDCWKQNLKGGLKGVERLLGIKRQLLDVDGYMAVQLWWDYINNLNEQSLQTLLEYNREDLVNLRMLRRKLGIK